MSNLLAKTNVYELLQEIRSVAQSLEPHLDLSLKNEIMSIKNASQNDDFNALKQSVRTIASHTENTDGPAHTSAVTILTKVNRIIRSQASKRN